MSLISLLNYCRERNIKTEIIKERRFANKEKYTNKDNKEKRCENHASPIRESYQGRKAMKKNKHKEISRY